MFLVDTHTHLESFPDLEIPSILDRSGESGVCALISAGTTEESSSRSIDLTSKYPDIFAGVGIHPMDLIKPVDDKTYLSLRNLATSTNKVSVISEVGLDFMEGMPDRALQYQAFREQIRLARELNLPIIFHAREASIETLRVLREEKAYEVGGTMHYFQDDLHTARAAIDLGFLISFGKPLLRSQSLKKVASCIPLEHIALETDSAPQPFKAKRENWTEPRHLCDIATVLAELKNLEIEEIAETTTRNFLRILGPKSSLSLFISSINVR